MRTASFFILSLTLHVGALLYPVSLRDRTDEQFILVTILPVEHERGSAPEAGRGGNPVSRVSPKPAASAPEPIKPAAELNPPSQPDRQPVAAGPATMTSESAVAVVSDFVRPSDTNSATIYGFAENIPAGNGSGGDGSGNSEAGSGAGNGQGNSGAAIVLTRARYNDTPRPVYPESARRDGREGRVLLRVLVDDQGRAKSVQINSSSGNEVLDHAAAEAIKHWRFHPALYGDKAVESWIRIPIEFRLAHANP
ncbi:MAG: TonB family protein [Candidatus Binatia bacterium]